MGIAFGLALRRVGSVALFVESSASNDQQRNLIAFITLRKTDSAVGILGRPVCVCG